MTKRCWMVGVLFVLCPLLSAQGPTEPGPALPAEIVGPPLVAWSEVQKPRPIADPTAAPNNDRATSQVKPANDSQPEHSSAPIYTGQSFTGTIAAENGIYILRGSESSISEIRTYPIDDQEKAKNYEGRPVRIAGCFDARTNVLHVASIEFTSI